MLTEPFSLLCSNWTSVGFILPGFPHFTTMIDSLINCASERFCAHAPGQILGIQPDSLDNVKKKGKNQIKCYAVLLNSVVDPAMRYCRFALKFKWWSNR